LKQRRSNYQTEWTCEHCGQPYQIPCTDPHKATHPQIPTRAGWPLSTPLTRDARNERRDRYMDEARAYYALKDTSPPLPYQPPQDTPSKVARLQARIDTHT